jgi:hypothetical protein
MVERARWGARQARPVCAGRRLLECARVAHGPGGLGRHQHGGPTAEWHGRAPPVGPRATGRASRRGLRAPSRLDGHRVAHPRGHHDRPGNRDSQRQRRRAVVARRPPGRTVQRPVPAGRRESRPHGRIPRRRSGGAGRYAPAVPRVVGHRPAVRPLAPALRRALAALPRVARIRRGTAHRDCTSARCGLAPRRTRWRARRSA